jgi:hypothetical protein
MQSFTFESDDLEQTEDLHRAYAAMRSGSGGRTLAGH